MNQRQSLADQAVTALAAIAAMDEDLSNEHAERHIIRGMKRAAEAALENGLRVAQDLAWVARDVKKEFQEIRDSAAPTGQAQGGATP